MAAAVPELPIHNRKAIQNFDGMLGIYYPKIFNQTSK